MNNKHLTAADRGAIEVLLREEYTHEQIAQAIGVNKSTVSRELSQRSTPNGYFAKSAQLDYEDRRKRCRAKKKLDSYRRQAYVTSKLQLGWSPEQIEGRLKLEGRKYLYVCKETIYSWLYSDTWAHGQEHQSSKYSQPPRGGDGKKRIWSL